MAVQVRLALPDDRPLEDLRPEIMMVFYEALPSYEARRDAKKMPAALAGAIEHGRALGIEVRWADGALRYRDLRPGRGPR